MASLAPANKYINRCAKSMFAPPNNRPRAKLEATVPYSGRSTDARVTDTTKKTEYAVERHSAAPTQPVPMLPAADDAVVEQATVDYKRQEQRVQLDKFQRDLKERLRAAAKAKRAAEVEQFLLSEEYERKVTYAALRRVAPKPAKAPAVTYQEEAPAPSALAQQCAKLQSAATNARCMMLGLPPPAAPSAEPAPAPAAPVAAWSAIPEDEGRGGALPLNPLAIRTLEAVADRAIVRGKRDEKEAAAKAARAAAKKAAADEKARVEAAMYEQAERARYEAASAAWKANAEAPMRAAEQKAERAAQKRVECARFVDAMRAQLRAELEHRPRPLPPLDACGTDPLVFDVDNCARNSVYYKNLPLYSRSLSGIIRREVCLPN